MPLAESILTDGPLGAFLRTHRQERGGGDNAVTGMGSIKGSWKIKDEDYPMFLDALHEHLFVQNKSPLNLVEQSRADGKRRGLIDLDFKYPGEDGLRRRFGVTHIRAFLRTYIDQLNTFFDLSSHGPIQFYITLRPTPYKDKVVKDGIHIQYDLSISVEKQLAIRQKLMELEAIRTSFGSTGYINAEKDIYDEICIKNGALFLYGESKPKIAAYSLAHAYSWDPETGELSELSVDSFTSRDLMEKLSLRHNIPEETIVIQEDAAEEFKRLLGLVHTKPAQNEIVKEPESGAEMFPTWLSTGYTDDEVALAKKLTELCLSVSRADDYMTWKEVGWCLYSISPTEDMFDAWMEFSKRSAKFSYNDMNKLHRDWTNGWHYSGKRLGIGSLHLWAKNDNPAAYRSIMNESHVQFVLHHVNNTHTHLARLMQRMFWGDFRVAVDSKKSEWYEYKKNCWQKSAQAIEFRNKMATDVAKLIMEAKDVTSRKGAEARNEEEKAYNALKLKELHKIEGNLYTSGFKDSVIKECIGLFYEDGFSQKLNAESYLVGFANGVVNLRAERMKADGKVEYYCQFREGKPEDFLSFQAGRWEAKQCDPIEYVPFREDDPEQAEIDDFMAKVFPRPELRAYMWRKLASCLEGTNREQRYDTWIGIGGNGKTKLGDLMCMALGDYAVSLQSTVLTRKRPDSGAANPDIMVVRNKRFIYMAEPDDGEPLNTSRMKQFTGEDVVEARGLFEDQSSFQVKGKMFMLCNKFPAVHAMDRGTWRRIMAVPFESKFVDPESEEGKDICPEKNIWPRDNFLDAKLKRWRVPFMARLVHVYETQYLKQGIEPIPAIVKQESENYRSMFDSFAKFNQARLRKEKASEACMKDIWRIYRQWAEAMGSAGGKKLSMTELQKRMEDEYKVMPDKRTFRNVRLFESDEDIEEFDRDAETPTESPKGSE